MTPDDKDALWSMFRTAMHDYISASRGYWSEEQEKQQFIDQLDMPTTNLIYVDDVLVGFVMKQVMDEALVLHTLCIDVDHQREGIGRAVIEGLQAEATEGKMKLRLNVLKTNPDAKRLYQDMGFRSTVETAYHYHLEWG